MTTINQSLQIISSNISVIYFFAGLPLFSIVIGFFHKQRDGEKTLLRYLYSLLTFVSTILGTFSISLIGYALLTRTNLLNVNATVYFLPLVSMITNLIIIGKQAEFSKLPGFGRLSGLIIIMAITFAILFFLSKVRILVGFFGSFEALLILGVAIYLLLRWSVKKVL